MTLRKTLITALLATVTVAPAIAQAPETPAAQPSSDAEAGTLATRYAACLVAERPSLADIYLSASPGSPERAYAFNALIPTEDSACAQYATAANGEQLGIPETILTGNIAEARYIVRYPSGAPAAITAIPSATMSDEEISSRLGAAENPVLEFARIFGDCVVRLRAADVDTMVRTRPGSPEESAAITTLQPSLGQCLWNGQTLQFSRETLRASLADALYRRALAGAATQSAASQPENR